MQVDMRHLVYTKLQGRILLYDISLSLSLSLSLSFLFTSFLITLLISLWLAALAQMVECLPLVQQDRGSIPGGVVNFHLKIFNLGVRRAGDIHFLIARLYITVLD